MMDVSLINDGPVTLSLDSRDGTGCCPSCRLLLTVDGVSFGGGITSMACALQPARCVVSVGGGIAARLNRSCGLLHI